MRPSTMGRGMNDSEFPFRCAILLIEGIDGRSDESARLLPVAPSIVRDIGDRPNKWFSGSKIAFIGYYIGSSGFKAITEIVSYIRNDEGLMSVIRARPSRSRLTLRIEGGQDADGQTLSNRDLVFLSEHQIAIVFDLAPVE